MNPEPGHSRPADDPDESLVELPGDAAETDCMLQAHRNEGDKGAD